MRLKTVLAGWRTSFVDLSGRNQPLNFKHTRAPTPKLSNNDEDPQLNPALPIRLEQFGIDWALVAESDCRDAAAVVDAVRKTVAGKSQWEVEEKVVRALFASHKKSMYQDLLENSSYPLQQLCRVRRGDRFCGRGWPDVQGATSSRWTRVCHIFLLLSSAWDLEM